MQPSIIVAAVAAALIVAAPASATSTQPAVVREERVVVVHGVPETWQLVWIGKPSEFCPAIDIELAMTCPCAGVAYGEAGNLWLIRKRNGHEVERMDLRPLFGNTGYPTNKDLDGRAYLQARPMRDSDINLTDKNNPALLAEIKRRPAPVIMTFGDYDRDGHATEFLLQVGTLPCGKLQFVAIGVSARKPRLHTFASAEAAHAPLRMPMPPWRALLKSKTSSRITVWECGDHGSEVQSDLIVSAKNGIIHEKERDISCATVKYAHPSWNGTPQ